MTNPSPLHFGVGAVVALRHFGVPAPLPVLPGNAGGGAGHHLLMRGALRRLPRQVVGRKGLGINPVHPIGPAAVVLDDFIGDLTHGLLLPLLLVIISCGFWMAPRPPAPAAPFRSRRDAARGRAGA